MIPAYSVAGLSLAPAAAGAPTDMSPGPVYAVTSATPAAVMLLPSSSLSQVVLTHQPLNVANLAAPVPTFLAGSMSMGVVWTPTPTAAMLGMGTPSRQCTSAPVSGHTSYTQSEAVSGTSKLPRPVKDTWADRR